MLASAWQHKIGSERLLRALEECLLEGFVQQHQSSYFIAVALGAGPDDAELLEGLRLMSSEGGSERPIKALPFKTRAERGNPTLAPRASGRPGAALTERDFRVFELGKRRDLSSAYPDRISVGRASNEDVVLRHISVSKFHAWFCVDEAGTLYLADADSTNETFVGGKPLPSRAPEPVAPGTLIRFGSVDTLVMDAALLWKLAHGQRAR